MKQPLNNKNRNQNYIAYVFVLVFLNIIFDTSSFYIKKWIS